MFPLFIFLTTKTLLWGFLRGKNAFGGALSVGGLRLQLPALPLGSTAASRGAPRGYALWQPQLLAEEGGGAAAGLAAAREGQEGPEAPPGSSGEPQGGGNAPGTALGMRGAAGTRARPSPFDASRGLRCSPEGWGPGGLRWPRREQGVPPCCGEGGEPYLRA